MSWNDYYRRRDALDAVIQHATRNPGGGLPFDEVPGVSEIFSGPDELLAALHYRWTLKLTARVDMALAEADRDSSIDRVEAVTEAWHKAADENSALRAILDTNSDRVGGTFGRAVRAEQRMLALTAGLAEITEPDEEITRVGVAFNALLHSVPQRPARRRNPVEQLLRRLVPSA
ncbi:hypothetical protein EV193_10459 [Herbihabitans rhizosphaerae]|uniref:TetR family transcriptional regulator n=1 Tax=Herbihabitans rhizosphaerae TaxID=1872711 RepID=A0A4Q7KPX0_9PSEU|nr:hypothetical protein [Herbihabitans rhizosphaerae]RZS38848.1 hypothetical protein EV193_10459 [Herbihabitans rhizosphaerae]